MPKDTTQAIDTLQAFVKTQQPLIDMVNYAIGVLQDNYAETIKEGDYKKISDEVSTLNSNVDDLTSQLTDANQTITDTQSQLDDANNHLDDLKEQIQNVTTVDDLTSLKTSIDDRIIPPIKINTDEIVTP